MPPFIWGDAVDALVDGLVRGGWVAVVAAGVCVFVGTWLRVVRGPEERERL